MNYITNAKMKSVNGLLCRNVALVLFGFMVRWSYFECSQDSQLVHVDISEYENIFIEEKTYYENNLYTKNKNEKQIDSSIKSLQGLWHFYLLTIAIIAKTFI